MRVLIPLAVFAAMLPACSFFSDGGETSPTDTGVADTDAACVPADEVCDGEDNDCDGEVDEDPIDGTTYYPDEDGDGQGLSSAPLVACDRPDGYVLADGDCNDGNDAIYAGAVEVCDEADNDCNGQIDDHPDRILYADADGDGFGDAERSTASCDAVEGYVEDHTDCDDTSDTTYPGAPERCDEVDNDCDDAIDEDPGSAHGTAYYVDGDGDGYGDDAQVTWACAAPVDVVDQGGDCDDADARVHPSAGEVCEEGVDHNCDGHVDYDDADGDGWGACEECDDTTADAAPDLDEVCDGVDNDCDGETDEGVLNACEGCAELAGIPGEVCGDCGVWTCDGGDVSCVDPGDAYCGGHGSCGWTDGARTCVCDDGHHGATCEHSCTDRVRNGDELDIDCGEVCGVVCHPQGLAAGDGFTCWLEADGALACVGLNVDGQAQPPRGTFASVVAGDTWACALDTELAPTCWGSVGEAVPDGPAYHIAAGDRWVCVLDAEGDLRCATAEGEGELHRAPDGPFVELAVGEAHACGRRPTNEVVCWGRDDQGQTDVPDTLFTQVVAAANVTCGLDVDGYAVCWGDAAEGHLAAPTQSFVALTVGPAQACGLRATGTVHCWGNASAGAAVDTDAIGLTSVMWDHGHGCGRAGDRWACWGSDDFMESSVDWPAMTTVSIERGEVVDETNRDRVCALDEGGRVHCGGGTDHVVEPPEVALTGLDAGFYITGGIAADGTHVSWGLYGGTHRLDAGPFVQLSHDYTNACGLTDTGAVVCSAFDDGAPTSTGWTAVETGLRSACAIDSTGEPSCWGTAPPELEAPPFEELGAGDQFLCGIRSGGQLTCRGLVNADPEGRYHDIATGRLVACAAREGGGVGCWGYRSQYQPVITMAPESGTFFDVAAGHGSACAVRDDGEVVCWGTIARGLYLEAAE